MKRHLIRAASLLMCGMLLLALGACGKSASQGDLLSRIKDKGELVIATEGDWAPWTYHDESDALVGLDVELGKLIADDRVEAKKDMLDKNPSLRGMYDENDDNTIVLYFEDATATFSSFTEAPRQIKF